MPTKKQTEAAIERISQLRASMKKHDVDALIISDLSSQRYLTGFSGSTALTIVTRKGIFFLTNDLYAVQVEQELYDLPGLKVVIDRDPWQVIRSKQVNLQSSSIGYDSTKTSVASLKVIKSAVKPTKLVEVPNLVVPITMVKTKSEIKEIARASEIVSRAYEHMLGVVKEGMTERQIANYLANETRQLGSDRDAFDIIVVSGKRSAMPHGRATDNKIKNGDVVTVDFGCCVNGFYSDMTRTFCVGTPKKEVVDVFAVLYDAHMSALDSAVAGITARQLDASARSVIERAGYGEYFRHSLGHGLGYEVHESPAVSRLNDSPLPENCVVTIEPGIYLPGKFGMRIEDDVVIGKSGPTILTSAPRELVVI